MLRVTVTVFVGSATETAVRLTGAEEAFNWLGIDAGAAYIVTPPLAVWDGLKVPHLVTVQLTCQSTPMFWESFRTVAMIGVTVAICTGEGGCWVNCTWIELGVPNAGEPELPQAGIQSDDSAIAGSRIAISAMRHA